MTSLLWLPYYCDHAKYSYSVLHDLIKKITFIVAMLTTGNIQHVYKAQEEKHDL